MQSTNRCKMDGIVGNKEHLILMWMNDGGIPVTICISVFLKEVLFVAKKEKKNKERKTSLVKSCYKWDMKYNLWLWVFFFFFFFFFCGLCPENQIYKSHIFFPLTSCHWKLSKSFQFENFNFDCTFWQNIVN